MTTTYSDKRFLFEVMIDGHRHSFHIDADSAAEAKRVIKIAVEDDADPVNPTGECYTVSGEDAESEVQSVFQMLNHEGLRH